MRETSGSIYPIIPLITKHISDYPFDYVLFPSFHLSFQTSYSPLSIFPFKLAIPLFPSFLSNY